MAGIKGQSGRKTFYDEKAISELVNLSVRTVTSYLKNPNVSEKDKAELARHFAVKGIPQIIQGDAEHPLFQFINYGEVKSPKE